MTGDHTRKLVTIVTEAVLEPGLVRVLDELGVPGYTISDARGRGGNGVRGADWALTANIRVEVICSAELAGRLTRELEARFYADFAMILFTADVEILRSGKF